MRKNKQAILDENQRKMSMQEAHALCYPQDSKSKRRCKCMKECTNACGCFKEKNDCSVSCKCSAKFMNKFLSPYYVTIIFIKFFVIEKSGETAVLEIVVNVGMIG